MTPVASTEGGLSTGAIIGIGVGGGIAGIIGIIAAVLIWWHLRSNKRAAALAQRKHQQTHHQQQQQQQGGSYPGTQEPSSAGGFWGMFKKSPVSNAATPVGTWPGQGPPALHELDDRGRPLEAPHFSRPGELDGRPLAELATPESQYYVFYGQGDPGDTPTTAHPDRQSRVLSDVP